MQVQSLTFADSESATSAGINAADRIALAATFAATAVVLAVFWATASLAHRLPAATTIGMSPSLVLPACGTSMSPSQHTFGGHHA